ncbi:DsbE family thiol:disulfide interchange protein [Roseateles paludis]|uniref:DsbE family thiol:disulfide interchange protein n=1 Tax=Roseateles paludis TaxID=3145238 RepID=A0ABV0G612_9BURK
MKHWKLWLPLAALAVLALFLARGLQLNPHELPSPLIGKPAPAFVRPLLQGGSFDTASLQGRVAVLNVFASWCAPCREEHPLVTRLAQQHPQVAFVGLNYKDEPAAAQRWLRELGDPYTAVVVDADGRVGIDYGVYGVPETFVIGRDGRIAYKHVGPLTPEVIAQRIEPLLKGAVP